MIYKIHIRAWLLNEVEAFVATIICVFVAKNTFPHKFLFANKLIVLIRELVNYIETFTVVVVLFQTSLRL